VIFEDNYKAGAPEAIKLRNEYVSTGKLISGLTTVTLGAGIVRLRRKNPGLHMPPSATK